MVHKLEVAHCPYCSATCRARKFYSKEDSRNIRVPFAKSYAIEEIVGHIQRSHSNIRVSKSIRVTEERC